MNYIFTLLVFAWIVVAICEFGLKLLWPHWYVAYGIPVYRKSAPISARNMELPTVQSLESTPQFSKSPDWLTLEFRRLSDGSIAFRNRWTLALVFQPHVGLMRGLISIDRERNVLRITGFLNYAPLILIATCIYGAFYIASVIGAGLFFGMLLVYLIQRDQFQRVMTCVVPAESA